MDTGSQLLILGVLFLIAYALGRVGKLVGIPAIPIYMLVGLLASPHTELFPINFESADVELVAVFGLLFLLFNLGLEFDQDEFVGNARRLLISGGSRIAVNMVAGFGLGLAFGWGERAALIVAGMTALSSSAIVTKLLIELRRLANPETPLILGIAVVEDIFVAIYLAVVSVVLGKEGNGWLVAGQLLVAFTFLVVMFALARWGGRVVSRIMHTRDDELFTILFFGLALGFGGLGELLGVSDAIGAFLIGLVVGATRYRERVEAAALPLRDVFGAFFFLNFGLALNINAFGGVLVPVAVAVVVTVLLNNGLAFAIGRFNGLNPAESLNVGVMLQTRGEFALILATLAETAGLSAQLTPFAGLYVLVMAIVGPILAVSSERMGRRLFPAKRAARAAHPHPERDAGLALAEAAMLGLEPVEAPAAAPERIEAALIGRLDELAGELGEDGLAETDALPASGLDAALRRREARERDPEY